MITIQNKNVGLIMFSMGAVCYGLIEILWRGRTHWSMLTAGGICFLSFGEIYERFKKTNLLFKAVLGSAFITLIELIFGIIFNIILKKNVWDYSKLPFNFKGQICLIYSVLWVFLSIVGIPMAGKVKKKLQNKK